MATKSQVFDSQNTSPKEMIRKNIRHALSYKSNRKYPNMDLSKELFDEIEAPADLFVHNFRALGGKFVPCTPEKFCETLTSIVKSLNYNTIFCADPELNQTLKDQKIPTLDAFLTNNPADAAVVFSDTLIARSGSVLFKQEHTQYPSVKHLAKDIIVISKINNIVRDLKEALRFQNEINNNSATPLMEIITPSLPEQTEEDTVYTAINQRFILFLIC